MWAWPTATMRCAPSRARSARAGLRGRVEPPRPSPRRRRGRARRTPCVSVASTRWRRGSFNGSAVTRPSSTSTSSSRPNTSSSRRPSWRGAACTARRRRRWPASRAATGGTTGTPGSRRPRRQRQRPRLGLRQRHAGAAGVDALQRHTVAPTPDPPTGTRPSPDGSRGRSPLRAAARPTPAGRRPSKRNHVVPHGRLHRSPTCDRSVRRLCGDVPARPVRRARPTPTR